jgi:hypothetical protein
MTGTCGKNGMKNKAHAKSGGNVAHLIGTYIFLCTALHTVLEESI